jgi:signal transduction histidine kinase
VDVDEPLWVMADPDRLRRVLINLLANAVKYTLPGGRVALRVRRVEHGAASVWNTDGAAGSSRAWAEITVSDTGVGIAPEHLKAVFQPYYRAPGAATAATAGAGLGLAICRELVEQMGGSITADSETGVGSTFAVRLPIAGQVA